VTQQTDQPMSEYQAAKQRVADEAKRAARMRRPLTPAEAAARESASFARATSGRDLRNNWSQMVSFETDRVEIDHRFQESLEAVGADQRKLVERAHAAITSDRITRPPARPGAAPPASIPGGWHDLTHRGFRETSSVTVGERDPQFSYTDPDSLDAENRMLGTPDATTIARYTR
jgi:hypothetical protein